MLLGGRNIYKTCFVEFFMRIKYFVYSSIIAISLMGCMKVRFNNHGGNEFGDRLRVPAEEGEKFERNGLTPDWIYDEREEEREKGLEKLKYEDNRPFLFDPRPKLEEFGFEKV